MEITPHKKKKKRILCTKFDIRLPVYVKTLRVLGVLGANEMGKRYHVTKKKKKWTKNNSPPASP